MSEQSQQDDGGPFFPSIRSEDSDGNSAPVTDSCSLGTYIRSTGGVSLRDWFAGRAMQALIEANQLEQFQGGDGERYLKAWNGSESDFDGWIATRAFEIADAMLKARNAKE